MPTFNTIYVRDAGSKPADENKAVYEVTNPLYTLKVIHGVETLKQALDKNKKPATEPWQEMINSYKEETDINMLIKKAQTDPTFLDRRRGSYADVTDLPKDLGDVLSKAKEICYIYDHLDLATKAEFGNVDSWISAGCPIPEAKQPEVIKDPPTTTTTTTQGE